MRAAGSAAELRWTRHSPLATRHSPLGFEHRDVRIRIHADLSGDSQAPLNDVLRLEIGILDERARRGERIRTARADCQHAIIGLDQFSRSGDDEPVVAIDDDEECLQTPQHAVAAPVLGELHRGARHVLRIALELLLELLEKPHPVSGRTGEAGENSTVAERAHLLGVRLHDRLTDGHLSITTERDFSIAAHGDNRGRADTWQSVVHAPEDTLRNQGAVGGLADRRRLTGLLATRVFRALARTAALVADAGRTATLHAVPAG